MTVKQKSLSLLLRSIADAIETLDDKEAEAYVSRLLTLAPKPSRARSRQSAKTKKRELDPAAIMNELQQFNTREEGQEFLSVLNFTRDELVSIANVRSIYVAKEDNIGRLKEKLIESAIGSRLNSRAIRGNTTSTGS